MEFFVKIVKKNGWQTLITSIAFAIMGLVLIIYPDETLKVISYAIGILFAISGLYKLINYFVKKGNYDLYNYDLAFGIIAILIGIATIVYSKQISDFFRILIGIWIVYSSVIRFSLSLKLKSYGTSSWKYSLILSLMMLAAGIYILISSNVIIVTIGIVVLIYAIIDIIESLIFLVNVKDL